MQVVINEVQAVNSATSTNGLGNSPAWVELINPSSSSVSLQVTHIACMQCLHAPADSSADVCICHNRPSTANSFSMFKAKPVCQSDCLCSCAVAICCKAHPHLAFKACKLVLIAMRKSKHAALMCH